MAKGGEMKTNLVVISVLVGVSLVLGSCSDARSYPTPDWDAWETKVAGTASALTQTPQPTQIPRVNIEEWFGVYQGGGDHYAAWFTDSENTQSFHYKAVRIYVEIEGGPMDLQDNRYDQPYGVNIGIGGKDVHIDVWLPYNYWEYPEITLTDATLLIEPTNSPQLPYSTEYPFRLFIRRLPSSSGGIVLQGNLKTYTLSPGGKLYVNRRVSKFSVLGGGQIAYSLPSGVDGKRIAQVDEIYRAVSEGEISQKQARSRLDDIASEIGYGALAWIVRNLPVYDSKTEDWVTFDDYSKNFALESGVNPNSRLAQDPVGTTMDLVYGNPSEQDIINWLGFGN